MSKEFSRQEYWSGYPFPSPGGFFIVWATREGLLEKQETNKNAEFLKLLQKCIAD